jgi:hypothetical protein
MTADDDQLCATVACAIAEHGGRLAVADRDDHRGAPHGRKEAVSYLIEPLASLRICDRCGSTLREHVNQLEPTAC